MSWMQPRGRSGRNVRAWGQSWHIVWITNLSTGFLPRSWRCLAYSTGDFMWRIFLLLTSTGQQVSISGDSGQKLIHLFIRRHLLVSVPYIQAVVSAGGTVLVNCFRGLSRSASCVLAYLIKHQSMTLDKVTLCPWTSALHFLQALQTVRQRRQVNPNEGFISQLKSFESSQRKSQ